MPSTPTPSYPRFSGSEPCAEMGTSHYFTIGDTAYYENLEQIKALCLRCPMVDPCLHYALHVNVQGLWAGTTETERRRLRRELNITPAPVVVVA